MAQLALTLSLIDLVVKSEGGGELKRGDGLKAFLLLKKGGVLIKEGIFERGPL